MDQYFEVLKKSKNFPRRIDTAFEGDIRLYPISSDGFDLLEEELVICGSAVEGLAYVQAVTEEYSQEHTFVLYGERRVRSTFLRDYAIGIGQGDSANFLNRQLKMARKTYHQPQGEVVYAHTHVGNTANYNCFSVSDLLFLVKQAVKYKRDVYGMLISKDGAIPIKYSYSGNEFFRLRIVIA